MTTLTREDRFLAKVEKTDTCWYWFGATGYLNYGVFWNGTKLVPSHRWSYEHFVGPIPEGLNIDHLCKNPPCVNPDHLEPVTQRVNVMRGDGLTAKNAVKTHCDSGHEFTDENTYINKGRRRCRECRNGAQKRHAAKYPDRIQQRNHDAYWIDPEAARDRVRQHRKKTPNV